MIGEDISLTSNKGGQAGVEINIMVGEDTEGGTEGKENMATLHTRIGGVGDLHSMITTVMTDTVTGGEAEVTETTRKNTEEDRFIVLYCVYHWPDNIWM